MPTTTEPIFSATPPPFIFDSDMSGRGDLDPDYSSYFESNLPLEAASSPGIFSTEDFVADNSQLFNFGSPNVANHKSPLPDQGSLLNTRVQQNISAPSSASPAGSSQDSSSESSGYKRKSSSDSSRSALTSKDAIMNGDEDMGDWKMEDIVGRNDMTGYGGYGTIDPASINKNFDFNDKSMENDFDFESAASSPTPFGVKSSDLESLEMPMVKRDPPRRHSQMNMKFKNHKPAPSQHSVTQSMNGLTTSGSREASPLSAMITSQESSPSAYFGNSPASTTGVEFRGGALLSGQVHNTNWAGLGDFSNHGLVQHIPLGLRQQNMPPKIPQNMPMMAPAHGFPNMSAFKPHFTIHPTPLKSRVETQIPIKLTLFPIPLGVTKLHLPVHTISKPKLLAKPAYEKSPDTLELYTTLVCTSAMMNPENRRRAFERAAHPEIAAAAAAKEVEEEDEDEDEQDKAANGGDVKICQGCINRERKRASRKKVKKPEEEASWYTHEARRIIVFNTNEVKDWQPPTSQPSTEVTGPVPEPFVPEGSMQVDAPMRIACYCRHQNEKLGFQVIFTIKDSQDRLVAQEMTQSIMITDDHKTHNMPQLITHNSVGSDGQTYGSNAFSPGPSFDLPGGPNGNMAPFRLSRSSSDLQGLQQNYNLQFSPSNPKSMAIATQSSITSAAMTPRNLSRQASPTASIGPTSKKRKASGSITKVPPALAMTRLETNEPNSGQSAPPSAISNTTSAAVSPFTTPNISSFPLPNQQFVPSPSNVLNMPYNSPPTPSSNEMPFFSNNNRNMSMENVAMQQMFSAPASSHPSRAPSPNGLRNSVQAYQQQQQMSMSLQNGLHGVGLNLNPQQPPMIHKIIPSEGPKAGGIEVTCLGSGFVQGLEVMFGDSKATTTTYWGETSLVCLLPPSKFAGSVPVTFKHQHQPAMQFYHPAPKQQTFFKYVEDDEAQIVRAALQVLGHKMTGKMEDVGDLARRIVGDSSSPWGLSGHSHPPPGSSHSQHMSGFSAATFGVDVEATLLRCLDLIDLDDSPNVARLNLRNASRQTMLHLACSLGLNRFVAALLARGANPEPRDKGGYTPMHFAALHDHPQIVRRLMLGGADPTIRSLAGYTPADMAASREVLQATRRIEHHQRTRSGTSLRTRASSASSLRSVWAPLPTPPRGQQDSSATDSSFDVSDDEDSDIDARHEEAFWMKARSRRPSAQRLTKEEKPDKKISDPIVEDKERPVSPAAAMAAFRDQLTTQITHLQQTMHLNLPNLPQMPKFDMALPDYQNYLQTARRITNLVGNNRPEGANRDREDYKWWDLFSTPPAYEDIFPQNDLETKRASAVQAAADTVADNKCSEIFDQAESSTAAQKRTRPASVELETVRIGQKHTITRELQDQLRLAHAERVKRLSRDRNLFFVWIPLLFIIILAMLYNRIPKIWSLATNVFHTLEAHRHEGEARLVEIQ